MGTKTDYRHFDVGARIRELCEERGVSHKELQKKAEITPKMMQNLLENQTENIPLPSFAKVCNAFEINFEEFFKNVEPGYSKIREEISIFISKLDDEKKMVIRDFLKIVEKYSK